MTQRYRAENERSTWMRFHTQTAGVSLTAQQPLNNLTRVAIQALAAVLGGTQSLHTDAYDEAWAVPSAEAALLALRQQQIIAEETGVTNTVDPLGGSWFVESLTNEIERQVWRYLDEIDRRGGMVKAIADGYPAEGDRRRRLSLPARARRRRARDRRASTARPIPTRRLTIPLLEVSEESQADATSDRLARTRRERDPERVAAALARLRDLAARPGSSESEPDARAHRVRQCLRHARRDVRRLPRASSASTASRSPSDPRAAVVPVARLPSSACISMPCRSSRTSGTAGARSKRSTS